MRRRTHPPRTRHYCDDPRCQRGSRSRRDGLHYLIGTLADAAHTAKGLSEAELAEAFEVARTEIAGRNPEGWAALVAGVKSLSEWTRSTAPLAGGEPITCVGCNRRIPPGGDYYHDVSGQRMCSQCAD